MIELYKVKFLPATNTLDERLKITGKDIDVTIPRSYVLTKQDQLLTYLFYNHSTKVERTVVSSIKTDVSTVVYAVEVK